MKKRSTSKPKNVINLKRVLDPKPQNIIAFAKVKERVDKKND